MRPRSKQLIIMIVNRKRNEHAEVVFALGLLVDEEGDGVDRFDEFISELVSQRSRRETVNSPLVMNPHEPSNDIQHDIKASQRVWPPIYSPIWISNFARLNYGRCCAICRFGPLYAICTRGEFRDESRYVLSVVKMLLISFAETANHILREVFFVFKITFKSILIKEAMILIQISPLE